MASLDAEQKPGRRRALLGSLALAGVTGVWFFDRREGLATLGDGRSLRTSDGGRSWAAAASTGAAATTWSKPRFVPGGDTGWVMATIERVTLARGDAMRRRFRFTRTQARLAEMLCEGMRPTHAAEMLGVKISTVRTHVGQMYEKTGTHSQAQLVALLHAV